MQNELSNMHSTLAFSVGGTPIPLPSEVQTLTQNAGFLGGNIIPIAIDGLLFVAIFISFAYILYGGVLWMMSQGEKKQIDKARETIIAALLGFAIAGFSFILINILGAFFNIPLFKP